MDGLVGVLESADPQNEIIAIKQLQTFVFKNEKSFSFYHLDLAYRRNFIDSILTKLSSGSCGSEFKTQALSALRILSRDKDGLGILTSEGSIITLLSLAELIYEGCTENKNCRTNSNGHQEHNENENVTLDRILEATSIVTEALKCLCNVAFLSKPAREHCLKYKVTDAIITRTKKWFDNTRFPTDVKYFDLRFLFLLTALENSARDEVTAKSGFCALTHALDSCIPGKLERKICHETRLIDGCGQLTGTKLQRLTLLERTAIEENPQTFPMTKDETRLSAEILKTLFNISLHLSDTDDSDMLEHCERIVFIVRAMFIHVEPLVHCPESLSNHALNIVSNMPRCCLKHLYWLMPLSVSKKLAKDYDASPSSKRFRIHFENHNMLSVQRMLIILDDRLKSTPLPPKEQVVSILSALCQMARGNRIIRKYLRQEVLPPLGRVGTTRPEEGNSIRNRLVKLMTVPLEHIKELVADFLFVLCKENVDRLVKYTGYGNAAGLLASRGLMAGGQGNECEYSSDEGDSETEEYAMDKSQIDPMIGAIPLDDGKPNPLDEMTEEEKEEEAEKLVKLIHDLNRKGVIKTAQVGPDGRPQEIQRSFQQDSNTGFAAEGAQVEGYEASQESHRFPQGDQSRTMKEQQGEIREGEVVMKPGAEGTQN